MNRDKSLDIARGLCIILVVVGHYIPESAPSWYVAINKAIYAFHMPAFMFISGYVYLLSLKKDSYVTFLAKKFKRLLIPYFVVSTIVISLKILSQSHMYVQNPVGLEAYLRMFYLPEAGYFLWFIFALWWMFVVIGLARTRKLRTALLCISIILYFLPVRFPDVFCLEQFRKMFVFFMSGVAIRDYFPMLLEKIQTATAWLFVCIMAITEILYLNATSIGQAATLLVAFAGIAGVICISRLAERKYANKCKWLLAISSGSYIIYLLHTTFMGGAKSILAMMSSVEGDGFFAISALAICATGVVFPLLLDIFLIRKHKLLRILFGYKV